MTLGKSPGMALGLVLLLSTAPGADAQDATGQGTELQMRAVTVKDQNQLRGLYGDKWTAEEVRMRAGTVCAEAGMRLVYFQPGNSDSRGRTQFVAVCQ
jgi:hypothetical protein